MRNKNITFSCIKLVNYSKIWLISAVNSYVTVTRVQYINFIRLAALKKTFISTYLIPKIPLLSKENNIYYWYHKRLSYGSFEDASMVRLRYEKNKFTRLKYLIYIDGSPKSCLSIKPVYGKIDISVCSWVIIFISFTSAQYIGIIILNEFLWSLKVRNISLLQ